MPLDIRPTRDTGDIRLAGIRIFLSTSIPNVKRWDGEFDALAITDAVVATGRAVLTEGGQLITAAHPTIAPLLLYLAREVDAIETAGPSVLVYQSKLFEDVLPEETYALAEGGVGELRWTPAAPGEEARHGYSKESLRLMREQLLTEGRPSRRTLRGRYGGDRRRVSALFRNRLGIA